MCIFSMNDVQRAFSGLYKEVNRETQQWYTVTHPVPTPRPGSVGISAWYLGCVREDLGPWADHTASLDVFTSLNWGHV